MGSDGGLSLGSKGGPGYRALLRSGNVKALLPAYSPNIFAVSYLIGYYLNITLASIGGPALVGLFATISNVFAGSLPLVAGAFADSHGRRYVILASAVLEVLALLSLALVAGSGACGRNYSLGHRSGGGLHSAGTANANRNQASLPA